VMTRKLMGVFMPSTLMSRHFTLMSRGLKMWHYIFFWDMFRYKRPVTRQHRRCTKILTSVSSRASSFRF
jgi:hypothetical protein